MAKAKEKKLKIYKLAAEINLASDVLEDFLKSKGFEVNGFRTTVTDEMLAEIYTHFKKDIEKSEKHRKKLEEFNLLRARRSSEAKKEKEEEKPEPEKETPKEIKIIDKEEKEKKEEKKAAAEAEPTPKEEAKEEKPQEEKAEKEAEAPEKPSEEAEEVSEEKFVTETEKKLKEGGGLKIVGKVELEEKPHKKKKKKKSKKKEKEKEKEEKKEKKGKKEKQEPKPKKEEKAVEEQPKPPEESTEEPKKKKKKLKAKKRKKKGESEEDKITRKKRKLKKVEIDEEEVEEAIRRTLLSMDDTGIGSRASIRKKKRKEKQIELEKQEEIKELEKKKIKVAEFIAVNELANLMKVDVSEVMQKCFELGLMVTINQRLDFETISLVADEFGFEVEKEEEVDLDAIADEEDPEETLEPRPPVVTIMGHVDHGKTSLLDYIRKTNVVAGEAGGITQHIGAYQVELENGKKITFLDTPGHEAFTAMRARGASVTDIVVLVVAADDAVMPQTVEAINHAKAAGVSMIVAINKIDKPGANPEKIRQQLAERGVLVEKWGGKVQCVELSAKTGDNVDELLERILLEAEMLDLKANPNRKARGTIIEAKLEKGRGVVATVLVQKGTLHVGEPFVAGVHHGRVRAMFDERNKKLKEAGPSTPVVLLGFEGAPQAGDIFAVVSSEKEAREISTKRQQLKRELEYRQVKLMTLEEIANQINKGEVKKLALVIKADVDGSVEALADSFMKLSNDQVSVQIIHKGVGAISESDVLLAAASNAIIVGFHVRPNSNARQLAEVEKVEIRLYNVIYDAINEIKSALEGMLEPVLSEKLVGSAEVREVFKVPKVGTVAGCYVTEGKIFRNSKIRLYREGVAIYDGQLASLKRFKDDVKEVDAGYECGIGIANFNDIKVGDVIEAYEITEEKQTLN